MTRRNALENITIQKKTHAGLWLDKYLKDDADGSKQALIEEACKAGIPVGYEDAYKSRFGEGKRPPNTVCAKAEVDNCRLIIGLGQKGVLEAGITLDHTWGVPYIPGSALKGIAAWAALQSDQEVWNKIIEKSGDKRRVGDCYLALFGGPDEKDKDEKGCVIFHDAWWIPEGNKLPIHLDVMTVHHQKYYQDGNTPPSDMDSPMPVPFVSVTGKFMIMLEGPEEWREVAIALLKYGLENHGIGAKTAGGYGRMKVDYQSKAELWKQNQEEIECKITYIEKNVKSSNAASEIPDVLVWLTKLGKKASTDNINAIKDTIIKTLKAKYIRDQLQNVESLKNEEEKKKRKEWLSWLEPRLPPLENTAQVQKKKKKK